MIEYLGNKYSLLTFLDTNIEKFDDNKDLTVVDLFSGTGTVSSLFKQRNYNVISNDFLYFCSLFSKVTLELDGPPDFKELNRVIDLGPGASGYERVIKFLNNLEGVSGFVHQNYSPFTQYTVEEKRMYFTEVNAKKIDTIRMKIIEWKPYLTDSEEALLIINLLTAATKISNVAGTFGGYLKKWKKRALEPICLEMSTNFTTGNKNYSVYNERAEDLISEISNFDILYLDPPYTKRQYSAYYHVLETIALYDNPILLGKTGLRNWKEKSSDFCYKAKAGKALKDIISKNNAPHTYLSYSSDGQMTHEEIISIFEEFGDVQFYQTPYKRYKSQSNVNSNELYERLYYLKRKK